MSKKYWVQSFNLTKRTVGHAKLLYACQGNFYGIQIWVWNFDGPFVKQSTAKSDTRVCNVTFQKNFGILGKWDFLKELTVLFLVANIQDSRIKVKLEKFFFLKHNLKKMILQKCVIFNQFSMEMERFCKTPRFFWNPVKMGSCKKNTKFFIIWHIDLVIYYLFFFFPTEKKIVKI